MSLPVRKIVSGGQTGVDRAALDFARSCGIPYGGWVPRGGLAEDMPTPPGLLALYPDLCEAETRHYPERTRLNIIDSDATLIVNPALVRSRGTGLTIRLAREEEKPFLVVDPDAPEAIQKICIFINELHNPVLNMAGPRESSAPGIYAQTHALLETLVSEQ